MSSQSKTTARSREREWVTPHRLSDDFFGYLCRTHNVEEKDAGDLKSFFDSLVSYLMVLRADLLQSQFDSDVRSELQEQVEALNRVAEVVRSLAWLPGQKSGWQLLPPPGSKELSQAAVHVLPRLADPMCWALEILEERPSSLVGTSNAASRAWCANFVRANAAEVIQLMLRGLAEVLSTTLVLMDQRATSGRKPYVLAPFVLLNLAVAYYRLGRKPSKSAAGPFGRFAIDFVEGIGWETNWVRGHIGKAVDTWRQRSQKTGSRKT